MMDQRESAERFLRSEHVRVHKCRARRRTGHGSDKCAREAIHLTEKTRCQYKCRRFLQTAAKQKCRADRMRMPVANSTPAWHAGALLTCDEFFRESLCSEPNVDHRLRHHGLGATAFSGLQG